jgi:ribose transport system permease protein
VSDGAPSAAEQLLWRRGVRNIRNLRPPELVARARGYGVVALLIALLVFGFSAVGQFGTTDNVIRILQSQSFIGIAAVGMTFVVLSGNFVDLSVPAVMAVSGNTLLSLLDRGVALAFAAAFGAAVCIGVVNGLLVGIARINPVIATLATGTIAGGLLFRYTNGKYAIATAEWFHRFGTSKVASVPTTAILFVAAIVIAQAVLTWTRFGAYLRATGANREAARASGVPVTAIVFAAFLGSAVLVAAAGALLAGFTNQADVSTGAGYEFDALAAVVIGGTTLQGGIGSFARTFVGIAVIGVANNLMLLEGFGTPAQLFAKGAILILAVTADAIATRVEAR